MNNEKVFIVSHLSESFDDPTGCFKEALSYKKRSASTVLSCRVSGRCVRQSGYAETDGRGSTDSASPGPG